MGKSKASKKRAKEEVDAEVAMAATVRRVHDILSEQSEQEIRELLLQYNWNQNVVIDLLLRQQETRTQLPDSSTTPTSRILVPNPSDLPNRETKDVPLSSGEVVPLSSEPSSSTITNGETRCSSNVAAPSLPVPSSSDVTNGETRSVPISSSLAVPSYRTPTKVKPKRQATRMISASDPPMADVLRGLHVPVPSKQNETQAPVKADDSPLHGKSLTESDAARDQLGESASVFNPTLPSDEEVTNPLYDDTSNDSAARRHQLQTSALPYTRRAQSIATASSLGRRPPPTSVAFGPLNSEQAMNLYDSQPRAPLALYGNMVNTPNWQWRPNQNQKDDMAAPFQQRGGSNSNTWLKPDDPYQSLNSVFAQYRNNTLPLSATSTVPSSHASAYGFGNAANSRLPSNWSGVGLSYNGSAYGGGMSSGNAANSRLPSNWRGASIVSSNNGSAYGGRGSNSRLGYGDYLPPDHHQVQGRISPFVRGVQGEDSYRSFPPRTRSQQEREAYFERIRADFASSSLDREHNTRYPFDQTQQWPGDNK